MKPFTIANLLDLNHSIFIVSKTFRSSLPQVFLIKGVLKYAANLQKNSHAEV